MERLKLIKEIKELVLKLSKEHYDASIKVEVNVNKDRDSIKVTVTEFNV